VHLLTAFRLSKDKSNRPTGNWRYQLGFSFGYPVKTKFFTGKNKKADFLF
jgi:hypothetical protein